MGLLKLRFNKSFLYTIITVIIFALSFHFYDNYKLVTSQIEARSKVTQTFNHDITEVAQYIDNAVAYGTKPQVVIFVKHGFDFESVRATVVYLKNETKNGEFFLKFEEKTETGFPLSLRNELKRFAKEGNIEWGITPSSEFISNKIKSTSNICLYWELPLKSWPLCDTETLIRWR